MLYQVGGRPSLWAFCSVYATVGSGSGGWRSFALNQVGAEINFTTGPAQAQNPGAPDLDNDIDIILSRARERTPSLASTRRVWSG